MVELELKNVCKTYDKKRNVLEDINISINEGEFFVLVGPSGCGKSTLLRMIAGLEEIDEGELLIGGKVANDLPPKDRSLSMVFQNYALYPHLSVKQNILFGLSAKKISKDIKDKRLKEAAEMTGLTEFLDRKPRELSGGQRQRVALARTIVSQSKVCLMDEPLSNLDAKLRGQMRSEIKNLQRKLGMTMVYVTHDQVEAMTMGDRIVVLNEGEVQQIGSPLTLYNSPSNEFVGSFIGTPKMNFFTTTLVENTLKIANGAKISLDEETVNKLSTVRSVSVGVRPENIKQCEEAISDFMVEVSNVEQLGDETLVYFYVDNNLWTAQLSGQRDINIGEKIAIVIDKPKMKFFNAETGQSIG